MNARWSARRVALAVVATGAFIFTEARATELLDLVAAPLSDPLLAYPPRIDMGAGLPGDQTVNCGLDVDEHVVRTQAVLTLQDAVLTGLCHNPQIQGALASIKTQAAQMGSARAAYLPTINAGISRTNQKSSYPEARFQVNSDVTTESRYATLTWRLLDFGGRGANLRAANALLESALASHQAAVQKMLTNIVAAYFEANTANAYRVAKDKGVALARQTLDAASKREARGAAARSDTLQAHTALAKAELEHSRAIGVDEKAMAALAIAIGAPVQMPAMQSIALVPYDWSDQPMPDQDLAEWLAIVQAGHPALRAARAQLEATREKLTATRSEGLPTLDFTHSRYINGRPNQGVSSARSREAVTGLTLNIPLFDGFASTYKIRGAQAQVEAREADVRDAENRILRELVKSYADAVAALRGLDASRSLVTTADEALRSVKGKYDKGAADILEMLHVQMALADAEQERIRALSDWSSARLRLLASAGVAGLKDMAGER